MLISLEIVDFLCNIIFLLDIFIYFYIFASVCSFSLLIFSTTLGSSNMCNFSIGMIIQCYSVYVLYEKYTRNICISNRFDLQWHRALLFFWERSLKCQSMLLEIIKIKKRSRKYLRMHNKIRYLFTLRIEAMCLLLHFLISDTLSSEKF